MELISDPIRRINLRSRAEEFTRKMIRKQKERVGVRENASGTVEIDESDSRGNNVFILSVNIGKIYCRTRISEEKRDLSIYSYVLIAY